MSASAGPAARPAARSISFRWPSAQVSPCKVDEQLLLLKIAGEDQIHTRYASVPPEARRYAEASRDVQRATRCTGDIISA